MNLIVINNFLNKKIFDKINSLQLEKVHKTQIKVYPNLIINKKIISNSCFDKKFLIELNKKCHSKAFNILKKVSPKKAKLYDYSVFNIVETGSHYSFPIHDDTPNKLLSGVIYLNPKKNLGTIFYDSNKKKLKIINWKKNKAIFFVREEKKTWHSYRGNKKENRIVLVYNLMTNRIKDVYKIENKNYFLGLLRYKINPILYKYFKFNL